MLYNTFLICAGSNAIIGSYSSEAAGGSSTAGWVGGMNTGGFCGAGAGIAGKMLLQATKLIGFQCLGHLVTSQVVAFRLGSAGSMAGQFISAAIDGKKMNTQDFVYTAVMTETINCFCSITAGIGEAVRVVPLNSTTTTTIANELNAVGTLIAEIFADFIGVLLNH